MDSWLLEIKKIIDKIADERERTAYQRGWSDCRAQVVAVTASMPGIALQPQVPESYYRTPERPIIDVVHDLIKASPGLRGTAIVDAMMMGNPKKNRKSMDRTTRTALMRLKKRGAIFSDGGVWFPIEVVEESAEESE
jgi:hypothetical protein